MKKGVLLICAIRQLVLTFRDLPMFWIFSKYSLWHVIWFWGQQFNISNINYSWGVLTTMVSKASSNTTSCSFLHAKFVLKVSNPITILLFVALWLNVSWLAKIPWPLMSELLSCVAICLHEMLCILLPCLPLLHYRIYHWYFYLGSIGLYIPFDYVEPSILTNVRALMTFQLWWFFNIADVKRDACCFHLVYPFVVHE